MHPAAVECQQYLGDELIEALGEALAHARGGAVLGMVAHRIAVMGADEVRAIRRRTGLSRASFAELFGLDPRTVQDWEQDRRAPDRAARVLLLTTDRHPEAVTDVLAA